MSENEKKQNNIMTNREFLESIKKEKELLEKHKYTTNQINQLGYLIENLNRIRKLYICILEDIINYFDFKWNELIEEEY